VTHSGNSNQVNFGNGVLRKKIILNVNNGGSGNETTETTTRRDRHGTETVATETTKSDDRLFSKIRGQVIRCLRSRKYRVYVNLHYRIAAVMFRHYKTPFYIMQNDWKTNVFGFRFDKIAMANYLTKKLLDSNKQFTVKTFEKDLDSLIDPRFGLTGSDLEFLEMSVNEWDHSNISGFLKYIEWTMKVDFDAKEYGEISYTHTKAAKYFQTRHAKTFASNIQSSDFENYLCHAKGVCGSMIHGRVFLARLKRVC
jgi:hypothetical protein